MNPGWPVVEDGSNRLNRINKTIKQVGIAVFRFTQSSHHKHETRFVPPLGPLIEGFGQIKSWTPLATTEGLPVLVGSAIPMILRSL